MNGATAHHHLFETALGVCGVAWNARGLVAVQLPEKDSATTELRLARKSGSAGSDAPPAHVAALVTDIQAYLNGRKIDFAGVAVDLGGLDDFRRRLYESLRTVAFGCTTTYGELARQLGLEGWEGARDVGDAMGRNPVPIVIPCHRVLAAGGKLGGFSAHGGPATKQKLLTLEGVQLGKARRPVPDDTPPRLPGL